MVKQCRVPGLAKERQETLQGGHLIEGCEKLLSDYMALNGCFFFFLQLPVAIDAVLGTLWSFPLWESFLLLVYLTLAWYWVHVLYLIEWFWFKMTETSGTLGVGNKVYVLLANLCKEERNGGWWDSSVDKDTWCPFWWSEFHLWKPCIERGDQAPQYSLLIST